MQRRNFLAQSGAYAVGFAVAGQFVSPAIASTNSDADMLNRVRAALDHHHAHVLHRDVVGVVNFGRHSSQPRFQLVSL